jgi:hypothetical protein
MKYFISTIMILIGIFLVIKTESFLKIFGYNEWAETKFASWGGSRAFYKLFGLALIIIALFIMTGWAGEILISIFSPVGDL